MPARTRTAKPATTAPAAGSWRPPTGAHLSILFDVFALGQRVRTLVQAAMRGAGLRPDEYAAYSVVFEDGPVTLTELARQLGMPLTTAADYIRSMVERGHALRSAHPRDQRASVLTLSRAPAGQPLLRTRLSGASLRARRAG
jgi:DNA-binding MarR family transcriptional regulator